MKYCYIFFCLSFINLSVQAQENRVYADDLVIKAFSEGIPSIAGKTNAAGDSIRIQRKVYKRGIGVQSLSVLTFLVDQQATRFHSLIAPDDAANAENRYTFYVVADRKVLYESAEMAVGDIPKVVDVDVSSVKRVGLLVRVKSLSLQRSMADWADAYFVMNGNAQPKQIPNDGEKYILTPKASDFPRINSPVLFGARPGNPFFYAIAASGAGKLQYACTNLPKGLTLDPVSGIITGNVSTPGTYVVGLEVKNAKGIVKKNLRIEIGDMISLTPPIGWNGWNSWARNIDQEKVIASTDAMIAKGLKSHGWSYINIDDAWEGYRGGEFNAIQPNEKFPTWQKMIDYIHSKGLKLGVYSTPMVTTYAGYAGASSLFPKGDFPDSVRANKRSYRYIGPYRFEVADAKQMAKWGVDYLKYDWRIEVKSTEIMSEALRNSGRDIHYSISNSAPFANAKDWARLTNSYRTGPDIRDSWTSLYISAFENERWNPFVGPGHWADPDMMIVGNVTTGSDMHPTRLTPDEQYSHISLFSLLAAPLLIGCPIDQLDDFTLNLLSNDEVIEINQDPLGKPADKLKTVNGVQVWLKKLSNGDYGLGLFNVANWGNSPETFFRWGDEKPADFSINLADIGLKGDYIFHDVWSQKDVFRGQQWTGQIPHHGVKFFRIIANSRSK